MNEIIHLLSQRSMLKMLKMMVKMILVHFLSRKGQTKKHVEDTEDDVEECWFTSRPGKYKIKSRLKMLKMMLKNVGLLLVQESTKCLA